MDPKPSLALGSVEAVSQELDVPNMVHLCLFPVDLQEQLLFQELSDAGEGAFRSPPAPAQYEHVVCIAHKSMATPLKLLVIFIEHDVSQKRTEWSSLGYSLWAFLEHSIHHYPCSQEFVDERDNPSVLYRLR